MHGPRLLLAVIAGMAVVGLAVAPGAPAKARKVKAPTKLWYRVHLAYTGDSARTYATNNGPIVNNGSWKWLMDSRHAVIVERGKGRRPDVSFSAAMDGELIGYRFSSTYRRPNSDIAGGRLVDCGRATELWRQNGLQLFDGSVAAAPASRGINVNVAMPRRRDDALVQLPSNAVPCTREDFDLANPGLFVNQRPFTIPPATPIETGLIDLDRPGESYSEGSKPTGVLRLRAGVPFGSTITKSWNLSRDVKTLPDLPPVRVTERYSLTLIPCPRGGRDVKSC